MMWAFLIVVAHEYPEVLAVTFTLTMLSRYLINGVYENCSSSRAGGSGYAGFAAAQPVFWLFPSQKMKL